MANWPESEVEADRQQTTIPGLISSPDIHIQSVGRGLPRVEAPEGWVRKVDRAREGKVWVGYFHVWETTPHGKRVRRRKEKTLGPASKPRHEALKMLTDYIAERTGKLAKQGESISTFAQLWRVFCAVKAGQWSRKTKENLDQIRSTRSAVCRGSRNCCFAFPPSTPPALRRRLSTPPPQAVPGLE